MYWIYLIIFVAMVFVPEFVRQGFWSLNRAATQELVLLLLGFIGFGIFLLHEKRLVHLRREKTATQREINRLTKDLTTSYSYIGETNRKLEIFKTIVLEVPMNGKISTAREYAIFHAIIQAVHILTKSDKIALAIKKEGVGMVKEYKSDERFIFNFDQWLQEEKLSSDKELFFENEERMVFVSQKNFDGTRVYLVIAKEVSHRTVEDIDMMKTLVAYALSVFEHCQASRHFFHSRHNHKH